jgi:hypothetical protein
MRKASRTSTQRPGGSMATTSKRQGAGPADQAVLRKCWAVRAMRRCFSGLMVKRAAEGARR